MSKEKSKKTRVFAIIAVVLMVVSMIGTALVESTFFQTERTEYHITLKQLAEKIRENNEKTGKDIQIHFTEEATANFHFRLFVPKTATAENPAPAIVCSHGGTNMLELQMPFYVELARRGYVVIAMDMAGHGESDNAINDLTGGSLGMLAAVEYLMSMPEVDETNIGITGHSYGNQACLMTVTALNTPGSTQRIKTWVDGDGLRYLTSVTAEMTEDLYMVVGAAKYGETNMPSGYDYLNSDTAKTLASYFYPSFSDDGLTSGQWYASSGPVAQPEEGHTIDADSAIKMVQYYGTHPMWHFTPTCTAIALDAFYETLGIPAGVNYMDTGSQIWPVEVVFELMGLIGFFMLLFPLVAALANTKLFSRVKRDYPAAETLPAFRDVRVAAITIITMIICVAFSFYSYVKIGDTMGNVGHGVSALFDGSTYPGNGMSTNYVACWTFVCGIFTIIMILLNYAARWLLCKDERERLGNPFASAKLDSISQFLYTVLFGVLVVLIMYVPVVIAGTVFNADFRICTLAVQSGDITWLPVALPRYLPMWLLFYIPYAVMCNNTRFKDMPEWLSTLLCAISNSISLVIMLVIQYTTIYSKGVEMPYVAMGGLIAFTIIPVLAFAAFSSRYIYKKTGNVWLAGIINGAIFCLMMIYGNSWGTDLVFI